VHFEIERQNPMSESDLQQSAVNVPIPGLSQIQRVTNTFIAPTKTFEDIRDKSRSWWLPFVLSIIFAYLFFAVVTVKVGWPQVVDNLLNASQKTQDQMAQATPEARAQIVKFTLISTEVSAWATPVIVIIATLIAALVLWGTINFVFGGKAKFGHVFCVWMFAGLPGIVKLLLGTAMLFVSAPDTFNLKNPAPTNLGAFLPADTNKFLMVIATKLDITDIWGMVLLSIGLAIVAKVSRTSGYIAVFGWWFVLMLLALAGAAFSG
jgi:hypothetical protein